MQRRLAALQSDREGLEVQLEDHQAKMAALQRELSDLKSKKDRLSKQVSIIRNMYQHTEEREQ